MAETAPLSIEEARTTPPQPSDAPLASPAPSGLGDDWHTMLGLVPGDLFESHGEMLEAEANLELRNGAYEDPELDPFMGSLLDDAIEHEAPVEKDASVKAKIEENTVEEAPKAQSAPAQTRPVGPARHQPVPNSVTVGRAKRASAGKAARRLGSDDDWGSGADSKFSSLERQRRLAAAAREADEEGRDGEGGASRGRQQHRDRKRVRASSEGEGTGEKNSMDCEAEAFAQALGGDEAWDEEGWEEEQARRWEEPAPQPIHLPNAAAKRVGRPRQRKPTHACMRAGGNRGTDGVPLPMVKRGSSASLASTTSTIATASTAIDLASKLYDAMCDTSPAKGKAAKAAAQAHSASLEPTVSTVEDVAAALAPSEFTLPHELPTAAPGPASVAGSDSEFGSGRSTDEAESANETRPASRNQPIAPPGGARVVGLAQTLPGALSSTATSMAATPDRSSVVAPGAPGGRGSKFERKDWTAEEDEVRSRPPLACKRPRKHAWRRNACLRPA